MKRKIIAVLAFCLCSSLFAQVITVKKTDAGWRLMEGNKAIEVKGVVWAFTPIGETHTYNLFSKSDDYIMKMIDTDMPMLKAMGVNTIRCFSTIPPRWVEYIYEKYGIYTMINDLLGRYGVSVNGTWYGNTDYSDEYTREVLLAQARKTAETYRGVKGVIMYMFGNESNYGLVWEGSNIENLPVGEQDSVKAGYLYSLLEEAMAICKDVDPLRPVGLINGDTQYLNIIAELCPSLDILGVNAYRGYQFYDSFFENVAEVLDKPIVFTEAGADAYNAITKQEDQYAQMTYLRSQWQEIYNQAYGKGRSANVLGGYVFEWIDEWWKHYQNKDLDLHNSVGTWSNAGYDMDYRDGNNNMDEEWFGLCAQSPLMDNGIHRRVPRASYYMLSDLWKLSLYNSTPEQIEETFAAMPTAMYMARGNEQSVKEALNEHKAFSLDYLDLNIQAITPISVNTFKQNAENGRWKDSLDPFVAAEASLGVTVSPVENLSASVVFKVMNEPPYSGLHDDYASWFDDDDNVRHADLYSASFTYDNSAFTLDGYYHVGHPSFENTGDIFGISKEAFDIVGYDTYGSKAPIALAFTGKQLLEGLQIIGGPEIWGGAKPQVMANYWKIFPAASLKLPSVKLGLVYAEEFSASVRPELDPYNGYGGGRKASVYAEADLWPWVTVKLGALHAGSEKYGAKYTKADGGGFGEISVLDTLGGFAEVGTSMFQNTYIYVNGQYRGLVADTNPAEVRGGFFTDDSGSGNRIEMNVGTDFIYGNFSFKPVVRMRVPVQGPAGRSLVAGSPFAVGLGNRQAIEFEAVLTYDPEGATWFHEWNIEDIEGAPIAASLSGLYTLYAGKTDPISFKSNTPDATVPDMNVWYAFGSGLPEQRNLWQVAAKVVANPLPGLRLVGTAEGGTLGSFGESKELVTFWKAGIQARYNRWMGKFSYQNNSWGAEEWWRTFNMTFPHQWEADVSYGFTTPIFSESTNRVGIKLTGRVFPDDAGDDYDPYNALSGSCAGDHYIEASVYVNIRK